MQKWKGFTLIELMIVVVILGILATYAIPAYQSYVIRARVTEGLSIASSAKMVVSEFLVSHNCQGNHEIGLGFKSPAATENVSSIGIDKEYGDVTVTYTPVSGDGTIVFHPECTPTGEIAWACNEGTLAAKYRPASCK